MSIRVMTLVWDSAPVEGTELLCLLAMADYAHDDGSSIFPSVPTLARRIRLSPRQTQRVLKGLAEQGLIERTGQMPDARYIYRLTLGGDIAMSPVSRMSPVSQPLHRGGDTHDTRGGDIAVTPKPLSPPVNKPSSLVGHVRPYSQEFQEWWKEYPPVTNNSKLKAWKAWQKLSQEEHGQAKTSLISFRAADGWKSGFIPHASTFLNGKLWEDLEKATPIAISKNGHRQDVDRRPAIKPAEFGPAKRMSDEKKAALREQFRREFEA